MKPLIRQPGRALIQRATVCLLLIALCLAGGLAQAAPTGHVYLVSVGCGDPDNITLKAMRTIRQSDILFCSKKDRAAFADLVAGKTLYPSPSLRIHRYLQAQKGNFGPDKKGREFPVEEIRQELDAFVQTVTQAVREGKTVSLLEGGDPCIYGPHIWIMEVLRDLDPVIIPGVSCLNAANAALGKGLTFGIAAHSAILTNAADSKPGYGGSDTIDRMAATQASLVVFTMFSDMENLVPRLRRHYPADTPVAIVVRAGYAKDERIIRGTLENILQRIEQEKGIPFEHLVYVGDFLK